MVHSNDYHLLTMRFISLSTILVRKGCLAKTNNHHGPGPPEARGPMQPHRLHRLVGPAHRIDCCLQDPRISLLTPLAQYSLELWPIIFSKSTIVVLRALKG